MSVKRVPITLRGAEALRNELRKLKAEVEAAMNLVVPAAK